MKKHDRDWVVASVFDNNVGEIRTFSSKLDAQRYAKKQKESGIKAKVFYEKQRLKKVI